MWETFETRREAIGALAIILHDSFLTTASFIQATFSSAEKQRKPASEGGRVVPGNAGKS